MLYAPATNYDYATYNSSIPITLYHQLARLVINLEHIKTGDLNVSEIYIGDGTDAVIPTTAKFHKPTSGNIGTWDNIGTEKGKITPKTETANACYSAVLIPGTYAANQKFMVIKTSDSRTYCYIPSSPIVLAAGNQYNYTISVKDLKEASTLTIADIAAYTYDGTAKEPHPTVTDGSKTLTEGTDYTLSWSNNTNAGTATVTVTGMGGYYNGTQSKNFTINPKALTITAKNQGVHHGTSIASTGSQVTAPNLVSGHNVSAITLTQSTTNVTTAGKITPSAATIKDGSNNDVTSNYNITYEQGNLTICAAIAIADVSSSHIGKVICSGGFIHNSISDVTCGDTPAAMVAYVGNASNCTHGLGYALTEDGLYIQTTGRTVAAAHTPTVSGGTWRLPTNSDYRYMIQACGGRANTGVPADGENYPYGNFRNYLIALGSSYDVVVTSKVAGDNIYITTDTGPAPVGTYYYSFSFVYFGRGYTTTPYNIRAVLAF